MLVAAIVLFGLAALGGSTLAFMRARDKSMPAPLSVGHGLLAATGLVLLIVGVIEAGTASLLGGVAVGGFALAALGGFGLLVLRLLGKPPSLAIIAGHALVATGSLAVLIAAYAATT